MKALDQFKQQGFVEKLKTDITPTNLMQFDSHQHFVQFLYKQVTDIDGMSCLYSHAIYEQFMAH